MLLFLQCQSGQDGVHIHRVEIDDMPRQGHGAGDLQEPAHPRIGQVDFVFPIKVVAARLNFKSRRIDGKRCRAVTADLLEFVVERMAVIDIGRAVGNVADALEHIVIAREASVG